MTIITSIKCPECGNDMWEKRGEWLCCTNCLTKRPYHPKKRRDDTITPTQQKKIDLIRKFFDGSKYSMDGRPKIELERFETRLQEGTGHVYVSVETSQSIWSMEGGHFLITRKGGLKVLSAYGLNSDKSTLKHYARILGGTVANW